MEAQRLLLRAWLCRDCCHRSPINLRYVPVHLEYIITEILKNSFRATVENHYKRNGSSTDAELPPVVITVSPGASQGPSNPSFLSLRIRDQGGGVSRQNMRRIFSYAFTTAEATLPDDDGAEGGPYAAQYIGGSASIGGKGDSNLFAEITKKGIQAGLGTFYGLGYGLPMSGLYARCDRDPEVNPSSHHIQIFRRFTAVPDNGWMGCVFVSQPHPVE